MYARRWGAELVVGSRSTRYSEEVLDATGGVGADYVLNSLTGGQFVERTMACMAEEGHWSEIGKRGIQTSAEFARVRPRGRYHVYDLGDYMREVPGKVQRMLRNVTEGELEAVCGRVYQLRKAKEAYQYMFEGRHVGKIVFEHPRREWECKNMVVVSGAFGGLGRVCSGRESGEGGVMKGAVATVLVGRRGASSAEEATSEGSTRQVRVYGACEW
jgi:hypothetical protein